mmetsp:Transcript_16178/g.30118  ORF Transcript_16178/g.30118 Transcript_16178/m.30118 type:complete len:481 (-) Transcript_16178:75-1517(-)
MQRLLLCTLHLLSLLAADCGADSHGLAPRDYGDLLECAGPGSDSACGSDLSLIQLHASAHSVVKDVTYSPRLGGQPARLASLRESAGLFYSTQSEGEVRVLRQRFVVIFGITIALVLVASLSCWMFDPADYDGNPDDKNEDVEVLRNEELPTDTLGFFVCALVRDAEGIVVGRPLPYTRISRTLLSSLILILNLFLQVYLFYYILKYVVPEAVAGIRDTYQQYEVIMYENHTTLSLNGEIRGMDGYFNPAQFQKLDEELQQSVCTIPFSQPWFFIPLLFIWTMSCVREVKNATTLIYLLIVRMPTVKSMADSLLSQKELSGVKTRRELTQGKELNVKVIIGLTPLVKGVLCFGVLLPRIGVTCFLCWLGSRWLAAASDFGDLVLDTVAVEFLLLLKNLLFMTLVSDRNKRDLHHTEVRPATYTERATLWVYISSSFWVFVAAGWVVLYCCYFQMVLLDYRWDVREECTKWITSVYPQSIV